MNITRHAVQQFARFALVGVLNTFVDLIIFNLSAYWLGLETSFLYFLSKTIAFIVAMINSYILNSRFTFKETKNASWQRFVVITIATFIISTGISTALFIFLQGTTAWSSILIGNVCALVATGVSMVINFIGYKLFVFIKK